MTRATMSSVPLPSATALGTWTMARAPASLWRAPAREYGRVQNNDAIFAKKTGKWVVAGWIPAAPN